MDLLSFPSVKPFLAGSQPEEHVFEILRALVDEDMQKRQETVKHMKTTLEFENFQEMKLCKQWDTIRIKRNERIKKWWNPMPEFM